MFFSLYVLPKPDIKWEWEGCGFPRRDKMALLHQILIEGMHLWQVNRTEYASTCWRLIQCYCCTSFKRRIHTPSLSILSQLSESEIRRTMNMTSATWLVLSCFVTREKYVCILATRNNSKTLASIFFSTFQL